VVQDRWQLQEAKNRLSEVVRRAREDGPQVISVHGRDAVVVLEVDEYKRLRNPAGSSLVEFFQNSPLVDVELDLTRSAETGRDIDL
jgi:antitoxin Phd